MNTVGRGLYHFAEFWWDFVVGDDWLVAVGVVTALAITALIAAQQVPAWWFLPLAVLALLTLSLVRAVRDADADADADAER